MNNSPAKQHCKSDLRRRCKKSNPQAGKGFKIKIPHMLYACLFQETKLGRTDGVCDLLLCLECASLEWKCMQKWVSRHFWHLLHAASSPQRAIYTTHSILPRAAGEKNNKLSPHNAHYTSTSARVAGSNVQM